MASMMTSAPVSTPRVIPETARTMAKADLRKPESDEFRRVIGGCLDRARLSIGWNLDELAAHLERDPRQVRRWIDGSENLQMAAVWGVEALRAPMVIALASLADAVSVQTVITLRRTA